MSTEDSLKWDAEIGMADRYNDDYSQFEPIACPCGDGWVCIGEDSAYGSDADGRRGQVLREWECLGCGRVVEVTY